MTRFADILSTRDLDAIEARLDGATTEAPGPWRAAHHAKDAVLVPHPEGIGGLAGERVLLRANHHFPYEKVIKFLGSSWDDVRRLILSLRRAREKLGETAQRLEEIESRIRCACQCGSNGDPTRWHPRDCPMTMFMGDVMMRTTTSQVESAVVVNSLAVGKRARHVELYGGAGVREICVVTIVRETRTQWVDDTGDHWRKSDGAKVPQYGPGPRYLRPLEGT